jgi:hypothetical protein
MSCDLHRSGVELSVHCASERCFPEPFASALSSKRTRLRRYVSLCEKISRCTTKLLIIRWKRSSSTPCRSMPIYSFPAREGRVPRRPLCHLMRPVVSIQRSRRTGCRWQRPIRRCARLNDMDQLGIERQTARQTLRLDLLKPSGVTDMHRISVIAGLRSMNFGYNTVHVPYSESFAATRMALFLREYSAWGVLLS